MEQAGAALSCRPGSYSTRRHLGPSPGFWLQGQEVEEGPGVQLQAWACVYVCVYVFSSVEGEVQSAPMWSDPSLPCILGNPVTPSAELGVLSLT